MVARLMLILLWTLMSSGVTANLDLGGYKVDFSQQTGTLDMTRPDGLKVALVFHGITEQDAMNVPVSTPEHAVSDFTALNFTSPYDACKKIVLGSNQVWSRYFYYESMLPTAGPTARLTVEAYFISSAGYVSARNELTHVQPNDIKVTFTLSGWDWCDPCDTADGQSVYGESLHLAFSLELPSGGAIGSQIGNATTLPKALGLGNDMLLSLSRKVSVDDEWRTMGADYPSVEPRQGQHPLFGVRVPKFDHKGLYDPVVRLDVKDQEPSGSGDDPSAQECSGVGSGPPVAPSGTPGRHRDTAGHCLVGSLVLLMMALNWV